MNVNGCEIPQDVIDKVIARMKSGVPFTAGDLVGASGHAEGYRLADRLLQRERKAKNIEFDGRSWRWINRT
jgi:hypothetical protein